jgi:hypothetical protein
MTCCRHVLTAFLVMLIASQLIVTCFLATNSPLPKECIVPYYQNSFNIKVDLRYLLIWFNILLLSIAILLIWTTCTTNESLLLCCARGIFTLCLFVMMMQTAFSSLHVLNNNNAGCWHTLYGAFVLQCLITVLASSLLAFMSMCYVVITQPSPHDPEDPNP